MDTYSYLITGAVMTPIAGKLSDIYRKKKIMFLIMIIYAIGVSIAGFASGTSITLAVVSLCFIQPPYQYQQLSTGLSLTNVGAMNVTILSTPRQFMGISLGTSMLMRIIGA
ncbi:MAG TPA: hypothetical protein VE971_04790, partial [Candidatus Eisenbacteria bacterium]|nr:hypothetical protein [Candidatus Eisenbacteria bacterium]